MPHFRIRKKIVAAASHDGHKVCLLHGADAAGLSGAACLSGSSVGAVASIIGRHYVGEGIVEAFRFCVCTPSPSANPYFVGSTRMPSTARSRDVKHIVDRSASVGIASLIAGDEAKPQLAADRSWWNARVQPQQIGDRSRILGPAPRTDRSLVLHENQQVSARIGCNRNPQAN